MTPSPDARRRIDSLVAGDMTRRRAVETVAAQIHDEYAAPERPPGWEPAPISGVCVKDGDMRATLNTLEGQDDPEIRALLG